MCLVGKQHEDHFTELIEQVKSRKQTAIKSDVVQSENEREEYLFDIVEVNSDESSNGADTNAYGEPKASKTFDIASDNKCRAKLTHNVRTSSSTIRSTSKPPRVKSNASSRKKQNLKENSVKSRDIITFFKPGNKAILEKITPVKLKNNAKLQCNNSPSLVARVDGASSLTTAYKSANQKTGELSNIPESPPFASSEKKHMFKNYAKFNSTAVERHNLRPELLPNLSPVFEDEDIKKRENSRLKIKRRLSLGKKKAGSFSLESKAEKSKVLECDTDSTSGESESLFPKQDDNTEDITGLTNEISFLVENAVRHPTMGNTSGSETESDDDDLVPTPPNLDFTTLDTQRY